MNKLIVAVVASVGALFASQGAAQATPDARPESVGPFGVHVVTASADPDVPEAFRDLYAAYGALSEASPTDFGFPRMAPGGGGVEVPVLTDQGRGMGADFAQGLGPAMRARAGEGAETVAKRTDATNQAAQVARGRSVTLTKATRSRADLEAIKDQVIELSQRADLGAADVWQSAVQASTGRVIISAAKLTPALAEELSSRYGTEDVAVEVAPNPMLHQNAGRLSDNSAFYGGARILNINLDLCSDAFAWRISGVAAMVTAGHCAPNGGPVETLTSSMGSVTKSTRETWNPGTGTVTVSGFSGYHGDGAIIQVSSGKTSSARIYRGAYNSTSSSPVLGMMSRRSVPGDQYCTGGSFSGEICGWSVSQAGINITYASGDIARNMVRSNSKQGWCTRGGDSGGSVFIANSSGVTAKGVHSAGSGGGSDSYGGALDPCQEIFTDIWDIYTGLPGSLAS